MKLKIFDVVKLNDGNNATIIKTNKYTYKASITDENGATIGNKEISDKDVNRILFSNKV